MSDTHLATLVDKIKLAREDKNIEAAAAQAVDAVNKANVDGFSMWTYFSHIRSNTVEALAMQRHNGSVVYDIRFLGQATPALYINGAPAEELASIHRRAQEIAPEAYAILTTRH